MKHHLKQWRGLLFSLLLVGAMSSLTSCGKDEPSATTIDYYLEVEEEFLVNGSSDLAEHYYNPIKSMREAIRKVYPVPNAEGNDNAVLAACDAEYKEFCEMYTGADEHFTCLFTLKRAVKKGYVVKQSEKLRTYLYDINPFSPSTDE